MFACMSLFSIPYMGKEQRDGKGDEEPGAAPDLTVKACICPIHMYAVKFWISVSHFVFK